VSTELYEVVSLSARYLFVLLGILIVFRAFVWLLSDRAEKRRRLRDLPNAGVVGEFVVISGSPSLPEGTTVPVPREGILGALRSNDIVIPCPDVRARHLLFTFDPDLGLVIHPLSGRSAVVDSAELDCRAEPAQSAMRHGSFLQVGSAVLRLRLFAGLDPNAGFSDHGAEFPTVVQEMPAPLQPPSDLTSDSYIPEDPSNPPVPSDSVAPRKRRSDRWEADWSD